jgi:hypothetical protein
MYIRYHKHTLEFWGTTDRLNDDPDCEYVLDTDYPLPGFDNFTETLLWDSGTWVITPKYIEE